MHKVLMLQPPRIVIGLESSHQCIADLLERDLCRIFFITSKFTRGFAEEMALSLAAEGCQTCIESGIHGEPDIFSFESALSAACSFAPSAVIGIGGGSVLDVAKLVAALLDEKRSISEFFGIGLLPPRKTWLACLPTTAGTGSEVSPNAILLDEAAHLKKGVISPHLVPDAAYIEPRYMASLPPFVTASTGMDALTHCIEAFANRFAHPAVDAYALAGIRLITENLLEAIEQPGNFAVREKMAIGSLYGGLCLGPVNTAGVHALSYPLGGRFHVPHGAANALLLPHVIEFTLPAAPDRYAAIAETMGLHLKTAREGVNHIRILAQRSGLPMRMRNWNVPQSAIPEMADAAMEVTRLLKNNLREITRKDALEIYKQAW